MSGPRKPSQWNLLNSGESFNFQATRDTNLIDNENGDDWRIIEFKDTLWAFSGQYGLYSNSIDGLNWNKVSNNPQIPFSPRTLFATCVFDNKLWMVGGVQKGKPCNDIHVEAAYNVLNDIWFTADGKHWQQGDNPPWYRRDKHKLYVFNNKVYLLGGDSYAFNFPEVWSTTDFKQWTKEFDYGQLFTNMDIRPSYLEGKGKDDVIYLFEAHSHYDYLIFKPGSKPVRKKFPGSSFDVPGLDNVVPIRDKNGNQFFLAKENDKVYTSKNLTAWKQISYRFNTSTLEEIPYDLQNYSKLYAYKGKYYFILISDKGEVKTIEILIS